MLPKTKRTILTVFAVVLAGAGMASVFPPFRQSINAWTCLVPLLWVVRVSSPGRAAKISFLTGLLFWMATLSWFPAIIKNNGPWVLVLLGQLGLAAWCAGFLTLFGFLSASLWQRVHGGARLLLVGIVDPLLWAGCEFLRGWFCSGFAWNFLGVSQVDNIALIQVASIAGVYGVSALLVLTNGAVTSICRRLTEPLWRKMSGDRADMEIERPARTARLLQTLESALPFALVAVAWGWGANRVKEASVSASPCEMWRVALIQPNTPCIFSLSREIVRLQRERLLDQSQMAASARPDLVVWPETAVQGVVPRDRDAMEFLRAGAAASGAFLLSGAVEFEETPVGTLCYNAAWLFSKEGAVSGKYHKQHLVPFGEYIPLDKTFPWLQRFAPTGESCMPGRDSGILTLTKEGTDGLKIGPLICFEDTVPSLSRKAVRDGAQALALMTNDAWFNGSCEPLQHQMQSVFRAVENGVPMFRCANSGVSCLVDAFGRIKRLESEGNVSDFHGFLIGEIAKREMKTVYTRFGDTPLLVLFLLLAGGILTTYCVSARRIRAKRL